MRLVCALFFPFDVEKPSRSGSSEEAAANKNAELVQRFQRGEVRAVAAAAAAGGVRLAENHRHADAAFFLSFQDAPGRFLLVCLQLPGSGL